MKFLYSSVNKFIFLYNESIVGNTVFLNWRSNFLEIAN